MLDIIDITPWLFLSTSTELELISEHRTQTFSELKLEKHQDKTFIGRIEKGFDFLGYHFSPEGLSAAEKTMEKFLARAVQLYEQERRELCRSPLLELYVRRWVRWALSVMPGRTSVNEEGPHSVWKCLPNSYVNLSMTCDHSQRYHRRLADV